MFLQHKNTDSEYEVEGLSDHVELPCTTINLIIGANNCRKSRFLRSLTELRQYGFTDSDFYKHKTTLLTEHKTLHSNLFEYEKTDGIYGFPKGPNTAPKVSNSINHRDFHEFVIASLKTNIFNNPAIHCDTILNTLSSISLDDFDFSQIDAYFYMLYYIAHYDDLHKYFNKTPPYIIHHNYNAVFLENTRDIARSMLERIALMKDINVYNHFQKITYIPTLRSTFQLYDLEKDNNKLQLITSDIYRLTIKKLYDIRDKRDERPTTIHYDSAITVYTGQTLYEDWKNAQGKSTRKRRLIGNLTTFISQHFFSGTEIFIIPREGDDSLNSIYFSIDGADDREQHEIGDGISNLILLLFPIFTTEERTIFLIEEPENHLHPGMQHLFLKALLENSHIAKRNHIFFISTHSNHLLNPIYEYPDKLSTHLFRQHSTDKSKSIITSIAPADIQILNELGVYNASILMSNCTIWLEGITDKRIVSAYLKSYYVFLSNQNPEKVSSFTENLHYSYFIYGGSLISNYDFSHDESNQGISSRYLSNRIFLLSDRDQSENKNNLHQLRTALAERSISFKYHTTGDVEENKSTGAIEIENTVSDNLLINFLKQYKFREQGRGKPTIESIDDANINQEEYCGLHLGSYLYDKFKHINIDYPAFKNSQSSSDTTLSDTFKNSLSSYLSSRANSLDLKWEDVKRNPWAEKLTISIYNFIKEHNAGF